MKSKSKPVSTPPPVPRAAPKKGEAPPVEWAIWSRGFNAGMGIASSDLVHVQAMRDKYNPDGIICRVTYTPIEAPKSPRGRKAAK